MKFRIATDSSLTVQVFDGHLCQFGITEAVAAITPEILGAFGVGDAAAATGVAADAAATGGLADIVGTGTGLFGGAIGTEGTLLGGGVSAADIASGTAFGTTGLGSLGTALDFLSAPGASAFNPAALTPGLGAPGGGPGTLPASPVTTPTGTGGTTVFDTGTSGVPGVNPQGAPAATSAVTPPGASASSVAAPTGVNGVPDATATGSTPASTGGASTAAPGQTSSISQLLGKLSPSNLATSSIDALTKNPLSTALGVGGLGYSILEGTKQTANEKALQATATTAANNSTALEGQGQSLVNYLTNGTLPPQYQTQITESINSAIANAKSNAAAQGQSTDPTKNSALAMQIQEIQNQAPILQEQIAAQLASTGTSLIADGANATGLSGNLYQALVQNDTSQAANTGKAIAALAAALNGKSSATIGSTPVTLG